MRNDDQHVAQRCEDSFIAVIPKSYRGFRATVTTKRYVVFVVASMGASRSIPIRRLRSFAVSAVLFDAREGKET